MVFVVVNIVCALLFVGIMQWKPCKLQGLLVLLPSVGLMANAIVFLAQPTINLHLHVSYTILAISAAFVLLLAMKMFTLRKDTSVPARFARLLCIAAMSAPFSMIVGLLLTVTKVEEDIAVLVCLSTAAFGSVAFLIGIDLLIVSICKFESTKNSLTMIHRLYMSKRLVFVRISVVKDTMLVLGKMAISIIALSFFMFANAIYSAGLGVARFIALRMHEQNGEKQIKSYFYVGGVIFLASIAYVIYSIRLFHKSEIRSFPMIVGIAIACYTFIEFFINIKETIKIRKSGALEAKALRAISLSSTLLCFVLTQTALMSFANESDSSYANALAGVFFGGSAALVGVCVMIESWLIKRRNNNNIDF